MILVVRMWLGLGDLDPSEVISEPSQETTYKFNMFLFFHREDFNNLIEISAAEW